MNFNLCSAPTAVLASKIVGVPRKQAEFAICACRPPGCNSSWSGALANNSSRRAQPPESFLFEYQEFRSVGRQQLLKAARIARPATLQHRHLAGSRTYTLSAIGTATPVWAVCIPRLQKGMLSGRSWHQPSLQSFASSCRHTVGQVSTLPICL